MCLSGWEAGGHQLRPPPKIPPPPESEKFASAEALEDMYSSALREPHDERLRHVTKSAPGAMTNALLEAFIKSSARERKSPGAGSSTVEHKGWESAFWREEVSSVILSPIALKGGARTLQIGCEATGRSSISRLKIII